MTRFYGAVGYGTQVESAPGVWQDVIVEKAYYGDVLRNTGQLKEDGNLNKDISVNNSISVLADAYLFNNFLTIKYVTWLSQRWTVSTFEVQPPRLILRLGEVYNGETPPVAGLTD